MGPMGCGGSWEAATGQLSRGFMETQVWAYTQRCVAIEIAPAYVAL